MSRAASRTWPARPRRLRSFRKKLILNVTDILFLLDGGFGLKIDRSLLIQKNGRVETSPFERVLRTTELSLILGRINRKRFFLARLQRQFLPGR